MQTQLDEFKMIKSPRRRTPRDVQDVNRKGEIKPR